MDETNISNAGLEEIHPAKEGFPPAKTDEKTSSPDTKLELLEMINRSLKLESLVKDMKISSLEKEINRIRKENSLLKRNFGRLYNILFQLLSKTDLGPKLYNALKAEKAEIFPENELSEPGDLITEAKENEFPGKRVNANGNKGYANGNKGYADDNKGYATANKIISSCNKVISSNNGVSEKGNGVVLSTKKVNKSDNKVIYVDNNVISNGNGALLSGNKVISNDDKVNPDGNAEALSDKSVISGAKSPEKSGNGIDINTVTQIVIHKNTPHNRYIEDGKTLLRPLKHEKYTAILLLKGLSHCYRLESLDEKSNEDLALKLYLELKDKLGSRHKVTSYISRVENALLYLYENNRINFNTLYEVFGYGRRTCQNLTSTLKEMQWIEPKNLKNSDAYYLSETGRMFIERVVTA